MINPEAIATAIAAQLEPTELNVYALPSPARVLPCIEVRPGSPFIAYRRTFGANGIAELGFNLEIALPVTAGWAEAYSRMYALLRTGHETSIFDLLAADPTFSNTVSTSQAGEVDRLIEGTVDAVSTLTAVFPLTVLEHRNRT